MMRRLLLAKDSDCLAPLHDLRKGMIAMDSRIMLATVVLDCLDAKTLASFYASLLGWEASVVEPDWVLMRSPEGGT